MSSASGSNPSARNIAIVNSWLASTSTTSFDSPLRNASRIACRASARPDSLAAMRGVDDQSDLADMARPAMQRHHRDVAEHSSPATASHRGAVAGPNHAAHDGVVIDGLLEERPVALRDAPEERPSAARSRGSSGRISI